MVEEEDVEEDVEWFGTGVIVGSGVTCEGV